MRSAISIADALRAAVDLQPRDQATRDRVLQMLGILQVEGAPESVAVGVWQQSLRDAMLRPPPRVAADRAVAVPAPPMAPTPSPSAPADRFTQRRTRAREVRQESGAEQLPAWLTVPGAALTAASPGAVALVPTAPLFPARTRRAILTAVLATLVYEGDIDLEEIVALIAAARPLASVPRLRTFTLRRGVQVLADIGGGMDPYRSDVEQILGDFDDLLTDDRMAIFHFVRTPAAGVFQENATHVEPWQPPPRDTPIVMVTDLGIGGPAIAEDRASAAEWMAFARAVRLSGRPLLALVPYEARRWPPSLARAMTVLHWSERTTVGEVRRAMRGALGRR